MLTLHYNGLAVCLLPAADLTRFKALFSVQHSGNNVNVLGIKRSTPTAVKVWRRLQAGARFI